VKVLHGQKAGRVPELDFAKEIAVQDAVRALIKCGLVKSAHDCSEGGLAVALAESCLTNPQQQLGATIKLGDEVNNGRALEDALFNEAQSRIVISVAAEQSAEVLAQLATRGVPATSLGTVGGEALAITAGSAQLVWPLAELDAAFTDSIARAMQG